MPIFTLNDLLIAAAYVTKAKWLNKNTISQNDKLAKFEELGKRRVLMTLESISVIKNRKRKVKRNNKYNSELPGSASPYLNISLSH